MQLGRGNRIDRIYSLHYLRGLAAILVVIGHAFYFPFDGLSQTLYLGTDIETHSGGLWGSAVPLIHWLPSGFFPVAIFFLLSGFVLEISLGRLTPVAFAVNRIFRIYPTFFVAFFLNIAMWAYLVEIPDKWFGNLTLTTSSSVVGVSWTLLFEMRYYAAVCVLAFLGLPGPVRSWSLIVYFVAVDSSTGFWLSYMALGAMLFQYRESPSTARGWSLCIGMAVWYLGMRMSNSINQNLLNYMGELAAALFVFASTIWVVRGAAHDNRWLRLLGDISYPLYCVHMVHVC